MQTLFQQHNEKCGFSRHIFPSHSCSSFLQLISYIYLLTSLYFFYFTTPTINYAAHSLCSLILSTLSTVRLTCFTFSVVICFLIHIHCYCKIGSDFFFQNREISWAVSERVNYWTIIKRLNNAVIKRGISWATLGDRVTQQVVKYCTYEYNWLLMRSRLHQLISSSSVTSYLVTQLISRSIWRATLSLQSEVVLWSTQHLINSIVPLILNVPEKLKMQSKLLLINDGQC